MKWIPPAPRRYVHRIRAAKHQVRAAQADLDELIAEDARRWRAGEPSIKDFSARRARLIDRAEHAAARLRAAWRGRDLAAPDAAHWNSSRAADQAAAGGVDHAPRSDTELAELRANWWDHHHRPPGTHPPEPAAGAADPLLPDPGDNLAQRAIAAARYAAATLDVHDAHRAAIRLRVHPAGRWAIRGPDQHAWTVTDPGLPGSRSVVGDDWFTNPEWRELLPNEPAGAASDTDTEPIGPSADEHDTAGVITAAPTTTVATPTTAGGDPATAPAPTADSTDAWGAELAAQTEHGHYSDGLSIQRRRDERDVLDTWAGSIPADPEAGDQPDPYFHLICGDDEWGCEYSFADADCDDSWADASPTTEQAVMPADPTPVPLPWLHVGEPRSELSPTQRAHVTQLDATLETYRQRLRDRVLGRENLADDALAALAPVITDAEAREVLARADELNDHLERCALDAGRCGVCAGEIDGSREQFWRDQVPAAETMLEQAASAALLDPPAPAGELPLPSTPPNPARDITPCAGTGFGFVAPSSPVPGTEVQQAVRSARDAVSELRTGRAEADRAERGGARRGGPWAAHPPQLGRDGGEGRA